ncbi:hypothetical protein Tco_1419450 [Tanacetum coccineum]
MRNCSAWSILNKLPRNLETAGRFLIPCEFTGITTCHTHLVRLDPRVPLFRAMYLDLTIQSYALIDVYEVNHHPLLPKSRTIYAWSKNGDDKCCHNAKDLKDEEKESLLKDYEPSVRKSGRYTCVPKKGGYDLSQSTNDENVLIPNRLVTGWLEYVLLQESLMTSTGKITSTLPFMDKCSIRSRRGKE